MDLTKEEQQRKEFCDILLELAKLPNLPQDAYCRSNIYKRLEALYDAESKDKRFRHFYTDIFSVLTQIRQNSDWGNLDTLGQNLNAIRNGYKPQNKAADGKRIIDVSDAIKKLFDHVNSDVARLAYSEGAGRTISGESAIENLQTQINSMQQEQRDLQQKTHELNNNYKKAESKIENYQREYIAILGIFAAVVLAFTGGIAFSTSVLNNIAQASIYRVIATALIIGLVLINILFGLFYYINSLVNKDKKIWPLIVSNIVLIILLSITVWAWSNGCVEKRDKKLKQQNVITTLQGNI